MNGKRVIIPPGDLVGLAYVSAAAILTFAATPLLNGRAPMLFFLGAVTLSAATHGLRSGLLATGLSVLAMLSLFGKTVTIVMAEHSEMAVFAIVALASVLIMDRLHKTNAALIRTQQETQEVNRKLLDHAESLASANAKLAEHREALRLAHEQLRRVAGLAALDMQVPLKVISEYTSELNHPGAEAPLTDHVGLITTEVLRLQAMAADLRKHAAAASPPAFNN